MDFDRERKQSGTRLRVDTILDLLPEDDATHLREALADPQGYSNALIGRTVTNQTGHSLSSSAVRTWRERNR